MNGHDRINLKENGYAQDNHYNNGANDNDRGVQHDIDETGTSRGGRGRGRGRGGGRSGRGRGGRGRGRNTSRNEREINPDGNEQLFGTSKINNNIGQSLNLKFDQLSTNENKGNSNNLNVNEGKEEYAPTRKQRTKEKRNNDKPRNRVNQRKHNKSYEGEDRDGAPIGSQINNDSKSVFSINHLSIKNEMNDESKNGQEGKPPNRTDSSLSLPISETSRTEKDASAGSVGVIDLLKHKRNQTRNERVDIKKKGNKKKGQKLPDTDAISKQRAAKTYNVSVRKCVERSDPDGLHDLLHDKRNHEFGLSADVLETVLKAFTVAAMFDEGLYCLRNCTNPGTMSTLQAERILQCFPQNLRTSSAFVAADMINALCIATDFDKATHRTYFMRILRGIALEFLEEATSSRDRICSTPCDRLVRSSLCVVDASIRRGKKPTDLVVTPGHQLGVFVPDTMENRGIQAGDAVGILPYASPYPMSAESLDRSLIEATVTGMNPMILRLQDKNNASIYEMLTEDYEGNVYRIDKLANRMGFNRQLSAAVAIASPLGKTMKGAPPHFDAKRPSSELIKAITAMDENIDRAMINGDMNRSSRERCAEETSTAGLCAQAVPFSTSDETGFNEDGQQNYYDQESIRDTARLALNKYGSYEGLNASQRLAVEGAATNRLTLVQGPPGTG